MSIKEKDIKLLWGRSGSRCAICRRELTEDKDSSTDSFPIGEHAHIVGRTSDSPRGTSVLTEAERASYHNLILLCPTDHTRIDKSPEDYPVEKLHMIKAEHELWVSRQLAEGQVDRSTAVDLIYASLIDAAVELLKLESWDIWSSFAVGVDARWEEDAPRRYREFVRRIMGAVWPGKLPELEHALQTLALVFNELKNVFLKHAEESEGEIRSIRFYQIREWDPGEYNKLLAKWEAWVESYEILMFEAAKALNWFADLVRRHVNPMFFAIEGKFLIVRGPVMDFSYETLLFEYTEEEKRTLPESLRLSRMSSKSTQPEGLFE